MRDVTAVHSGLISYAPVRLPRSSGLYWIARALILSGLLGVLQVNCAYAASQASGRTAGTFTVSATGASNYTIPLWTPPGPHGLQPHLALVYNSHAGNGYVGVGWNLAGLSAITRCNLTVAQDGAAAPITLTPSDGLCLDGQRLRLTSSGNYGLAGSTYQTEIANFSNVTAFGSEGSGPQYFVVQTKDGLTYTYGQSGNSEVQGASGSTVSAWLVDEVKDRAGNTMLISYCSSNASANPGNCPSSSTLAYSNVPASISWTPTTPGGSTYTYTAQFYYQDLSVPAMVGYLAGNQLILQVALTSVIIEANSSPVKQYTLAYSPSATTNRDLLTSVTECNGSGDTCLAPTQIHYQTGGYGVQNAATLNATGPIQSVLSNGDFDGHGRTDLAWYAGGVWYVCLATDTGYGEIINTGITSANVLVDNINDTETSGFLVQDQQSGYWWYYKYNGSNPFIGTKTSAAITSTQSNSYALVDVDGDGRPDLVTLQSNTAVILYMNISSGGNVDFSPGTAEPMDFGSTSTLDLFAFHGSAEAARPSFDGSGRQNVFLLVSTVGPGPDYLVSTQELSGLYNSSNGLVFTFILPDGAAFPIDSADLNEDGCADLWSFTAVIYSACNGSAASTDAFDYTVLGAFDWNGDGLADVLVDYNGYLGVYVSNGTAFTFQSTGIPTTGTAFVIHNATGDGQDALGFYSGSTITYYLHNGSGTPPDLMSQVKDGFGNYAAPAYTPIAQSSSYVNLSDAGYPQANYIGPIYVVSGVTLSDPSATNLSYNQTYGYVGAWMNLQGRGFEGFQQVSMHDSRSSLYSTQYYKQDFPFIGMLVQSVQSNGSFSVNSLIITPTAVELSNATNQQRYFPSVSTEEIQRREVNSGGTDDGALIDTTDFAFTFDNFGNLLTQVKTVTDNDPNSPYNSQSWTTSIQYTPDIDQNEQTDLTQWCLSVNVPTLTTYTASSGITRSVQKSYTTDTSENCRIHSVTTAPGTAYAVTETYGYDAFGNINADTVAGTTMPASPASRETQYSWGPAGQFLWSKTDASNATTQWSYTSLHSLTFGVPDSMKDPNGLTTQWAYDDFGRKQNEIRPDNTSTSWTWTTCAPSCGWSNSEYEVTATQYQTNHSTIIRADTTLYDPVDRVTETEGPTVSGTNAIVQQTYTRLGQISQKSAPFLAGSASHLISYTYDPLNRLTEVSSAYNASDETPESTKYVYAGRTTSITDRRNDTTTIVKDVNGWLRETRDSVGYSVTTAYDAAGDKTVVTDSNGNTLWAASTSSMSDCYVYGIRAFLTCATDQKLGAWQYTVDSLGEVTNWTDAKGQNFSATYDALSRPLSRTDPDPLVTQWTWGTPASGNAGLLVSECTGSAYGPSTPCTTATSSPSFIENRTYDADSRLQTRSITLSGNPGNDNGQFLYTYSYDANTGLLSALQYPTSTSGAALKLGYGYYAGLLQSVTDMTDSAATCGTTCTLWSLAVSESNNSQIVAQETLGNNLVMQRSYDALTGLLSKATAGPNASASVLNQSYAYDPDGNLSQRQDNNQTLTENFFYDGDNRLCVVSASPISSCDSATISYDGGSAGPGNITSKIDSAGTLTSYGTTWTSYNYPASITAGAESLTFSYGPDRQRWQQSYTNNGSTETTDYIGGLMEEVNGGGITDYRHYIYAGNEPIAVYSRKSTLANTFSYLLTDQEGSIAAITNSSGATVINESFTPSGVRRNPSTWSGSPSQSDLDTIAGVTRQGYTFQTALGQSTGLNHLNGRVQDATIGRFISADPYIPDVSTAQDYNRYSYVTNNPLTYVDPSGFDGIVTATVCYYVAAAPFPLEGNTTEGGSGNLPEVEVTSTQLPLFCETLAANVSLPSLPGSDSLGNPAYGSNGGPGGGTPSNPPADPKSPQTRSNCNQGLVDAGNIIESASGTLSKVSEWAEGAGLAAGVAGLVVPGLGEADAAGGFALAGAGGLGTLIGAGLQAIGGAAQLLGGASGAGKANALYGTFQAATGLAIGFGITGMVSEGASFAERMTNNFLGRTAAAAGLAQDALTGFHPSLAPQQGSCQQ